MTFDLDAEQAAIFEMACDFAAAEIAPHALDWDRDHHFPVDTFRKAAELGMGGLYVDSAYGGSELGRLAGTLVIAGLARGCPSVAAYISIHNMCAGMIQKYGTEEQRARFLPALCTMEHLSSYCLTEPGAGSDAAALATRAVREGDDYLLSGQKQFISGAGSSDIYIVMARTGGPGAKGISAFIVEKDSAGLSFGANEQKMGWRAQPTRTVVMENLRVPARNMLGAEGEGFKIAMAGLDGGRLSIAAAALGGAEVATAKALTYLGERKAFGQTLDRFQALQFRVAEMETDLEVARTFLWRAAAQLEKGPSPEATRLCAMAKLFVTDKAFEVANNALQLFGGYGYLADYGVEKIVRDLRVHQILEGTNEIMRLIISRQVLGAR